MHAVVVLGASWGGLRALQTVLGALPADFPVPIAVAQHRGRDSDDELLAGLLDRAVPLHVRDADDKDELQPGQVLVAPPGYHLMVEAGGVALSIDEPVAYSRPSIDVLFQSAADAFGEGTIGVVLTGANADGAAGLAAIRARGGLALVQDPETAERPEMPRAALAACSALTLPLERIGPELRELVSGGGT